MTKDYQPCRTRRPPLLALLVLGSVAGLVSGLPAVAAAAGSKIRIGWNTDDLDKAKKTGFDYAEVLVRNYTRLSDEEFAKLLEKHKAVGLPTPVGNNFIPMELKMVGPEIDKDKQIEYVRKAFERGQKLGLKIIVLGSGAARKVPDGFSKDEAFKQLVDFGKRIAPEARKRGIVVAVEPLQTKETNIINSAGRGAEVGQGGQPPQLPADGRLLPPVAGEGGTRPSW
jgi:sugar phosphate isomerase/epimerase